MTGVPTVSPLRLVATLAIAGSVAGLALVSAYEATLPRIQAHKQEVLERAIGEVLHAPARFETLYERDGRLSAEPPPGVKNPDRVYLGYAEDGRPVGFAIVASGSGFQDTIRLIFGYDAAAKKMLGMRVLESKETPGLGDKIEKDEHFVKQFDGCAAPPAGVRAGTKSKPNEIDMITGATISSRTVVNAINEALTRVRPLVESYRPAAGGAEQ